ncbi:MAG: FkbM family methyltransferase [Armatimonadota bacterium]
MLFYPDYNICEIEFLMSCVPEGGTFVDVGANVGLYSLPLAVHVGHNGRVLAIEPGAVSLARLRVNLVASDAHHVVVAPYAIGERRGESYLHVPSRNVGGATVSEVASGEMVGTMPFLEVLEEHGIDGIDGLKVDVEGCEDYVVVPLLKAQKKDLWPQGIVIEHLHRGEWRADCLDLLQRNGYEIVGTTQSNTMFRRMRGE